MRDRKCSCRATATNSRHNADDRTGRESSCCASRCTRGSTGRCSCCGRLRGTFPRFGCVCRCWRVRRHFGLSIQRRGDTQASALRHERHGGDIHQAGSRRDTGLGARSRATHFHAVPDIQSQIRP